MKISLVFLILASGAFARSTVPQPKTNGEGPQSTILSNEMGHSLPLNVTLHDVLNIEVGSQITDLKIEGLSTLHYKFDPIGLLLAFHFNVSISNVIGTAGDYFASGYIDARPFSQETIPSGNFTGSGAGSFSATNVRLDGSVHIFSSIDNKVGLYRLRLDVVSFDSLTVDLGPDFIIAGSPVDWDALSAGIKANFDREFATNKVDIVERIRKAVSTFLNNYTLKELIELLPGFGDGGEPEC